MTLAITNGTEKQNAFATKLRADFLDGVRAQIGFAQRPGWGDAGKVARLATLIPAAESIADARFWLDNGRDFSRCCNAVANRTGAQSRTCGELSSALLSMRPNDPDRAAVEAAYAAAKAAPENWADVRASERTPEQARLAAEAGQ